MGVMKKKISREIKRWKIPIENETYCFKTKFLRDISKRNY